MNGSTVDDDSFISYTETGTVEIVGLNLEITNITGNTRNIITYTASEVLFFYKR